jgi:bacteriocin-like protein
VHAISNDGVPFEVLDDDELTRVVGGQSGPDYFEVREMLFRNIPGMCPCGLAH